MRDPGSCHHPRCDLHAHQLLEEQLACVWHKDLRDARLVSAAAALEGSLVEVSDRDHAADVTYVDAEGVRRLEEALLENGGDAVRDHAIPLHLAKAEAAVARAPLHRLPREQSDRPARARVDLVIHHMLEPLVVGWAQKHVRLHSPPGVPVEHHLKTALLVAKILQELGDLIHVDRREGRRIALVASERRHLGEKAFNQVANRHPRRDGVGVDDDVRRDAFAREGHVLLPVRDADGPLLPVARRELVSDLRHSHRAHAHLDKLAPLLVGRQEDLVDVARLARAQRRRRISPLVPRLRRVQHLLRLLLDGRRLADDDVVARHARAGRHQPVVVELRVVALAHAGHRLALRPLEALGALHAANVRLALLVFVRAVEDRAEKAAVDGALVHDDGVLLVVPGVARDGDGRIDARWELAEIQIRHGACDAERLLRVEEHMRQRIHPQLVVGDVYAHRLLAHGRLVGVTRRLVVVGEGDDRGADAEDHRRVDLAVRVLVHEIVG
mmetsp:Transcript_19783/g.45566  ORF Transcript_19783/g.45566 Transcript_19783/m.45566 type:complete len:498 (-) Transcript_19783:580-2073(-)